MDAPSLLAAITALEPEAKEREKADRTAITVPADKVHALALRLRDEPALSFELLYDHTAIDWPEEDRFELVYQLGSLRHGHPLMVSVSIPRGMPVVPTLSTVWPIAEWLEREVFDLFGVLYSGHPDLRRLFLEDDWKGFPLRKDYKDDFVLERPR